MKVTWEQHKFPGGMDQHWQQMEREPLEQNELEATYTVHTSGFWICKGTLTHLNEDAWETKATLEANLSLGEMKGKVSLILEKPDS